MKIKLLLIPAFILGSILYVNAQTKTDPINPDAVAQPALLADDPQTTSAGVNSGGSESIKSQKSETAVSTKQVNAPNTKNDIDKNKNAVITTNKASIKSKSTK